MGADPVRSTVAPLFSAPFPSELDGRSFNQIADEWDDENTIRELGS